MKKIKNIFDMKNFCLFFAILFSSMLGYSIAGISINKIALVPLIIAIIFGGLVQIKDYNLSLNKLQIILILIYSFSIVSCFFNYMKNYNYKDYYSRLSFWVLQILIFYLPIIFFAKRAYKNNFKNIFMNCLCIVCRIQSVWAIFQFFFYYIIGKDINFVLFNEILGGFIKGSESAYLYDRSELALRVTGFNYDPAFLGILLVLGFCIDKKIYKYIYFIVACLAMSRTAIISIIVVFLYDRVVHPHKVTKSSKKLLGIAGVLLGILALWIFYRKNPYFSYQIDYVISRMQNIFNGATRDQGTSRHILYIPYAIYSWIFEANIIEKLIGIGSRVSGLAFSTSNFISSKMILTNNMKTSAWGIECDFADVLLGLGLIVLVLYYYILFKIFKTGEENDKKIAISLFIFGFMYNCFTTTLVQLLLIVLTSNYQNENRNRNNNTF